MMSKPREIDREKDSRMMSDIAMTIQELREENAALRANAATARAERQIWERAATKAAEPSSATLLKDKQAEVDALDKENALLRRAVARLEGMDPDTLDDRSPRQVRALYGPSPTRLDHGHGGGVGKASLYEILYLDAKRLHTKQTQELQEEVRRVKEQLKRSEDELASSKASSKSEAQQFKDESTRQKDEMLKLHSDVRLAESERHRNLRDSKWKQSMSLMKAVLQRWQRTFRLRLLMEWRRNVAVATGSGATAMLNRLESERLQMEMRCSKMEQAANSAYAEEEAVRKQMEAMRDEVALALQKVAAEMKEIGRHKHNLQDEITLVQAERVQLQKVLALSKSSEDGPKVRHTCKLTSALCAAVEKIIATVLDLNLCEEMTSPSGSRV